MKAASSTAEVKRDILWRVYLCFIAVAVVCGGIIVKAFVIQQVQGAHWRSLGDTLHIKEQDVVPERGTIYSEDGQMISTSIPQFDLYVDFGADGLRDKSGKLFRTNLDSLTYCLANLFKDRTKAEYKKILNDGYRKDDRYFLLKKRVSFREYQQLRNFPLVRLGKNTSGFIAQVSSIRLNPYQMLAYRTIGLDRENSQKIGLEQAYDSTLTGVTGKRLVRNLGGGVIVPVDDALQVEPENGKDVITTLDMHIQEITENALYKMMVQSESQTGTCIVMETKTGKIKALANLGRKADGDYWEDYNYAMRTSEPGSTIKLLTLLAIMSEGVSVNTPVEVGSTASAYVGVRNVFDDERMPAPVMSVKQCFAHSSNIGMGRIAYKTFGANPAKFVDYINKFRLNKTTGVDLPGEGVPRHLKVSKRNEGLNALVTMSFGYGIQVSPLQTLTLYNAVANNGKMMKPYLVNSIQKDGAVVKESEPVVLNDSLCSSKVINAAKDCMLAVTTDGTAKKVFVNAGYPVAGKTGTAHVADGKYGYGDGVYQASFVGYFPANDPQYTCIVVIKTKPYAAQHFGWQLAAPVFKEISDRLYTMYVRQSSKQLFADQQNKDSIPYNYKGSSEEVSQVLNTLSVKFIDSAKQENEWVKLYKPNAAPVAKNIYISNNQMPELNGMGLKDAIYVCENLGLKVNARGKGKVTTQSVSAGDKINKGQQITIALN